ncbi:MAG: AmmeMemoRadiSam system radical SAM enzyme, partial [Candidatus Omnitrophica bacterium]|nr:AmmeMemoRadiSam system radical SAM enzyme [Candidatus Omnitrophota bacterium]
AKKAQCRCVAFTYNEPIISAEYAIDTARECHALNVKTVAVTAGYISEEAREEFFEHMDAANVDLKAFSERFYKKLCLAKLQPVLDTLIYIKKKTKVWLEITNLIIPGENDSQGELKALAKWVVENLGEDVPVHFSAFHPSFQMVNTPITSKETLVNARAIAVA